MTFRTSWGISFHEYLVPLFSVRVSLQTRADRIGLNPRDRIRARSNRAKPKDRIGRNPNGPHPVDPEGSRPAETQVDPGRIRVVDPERTSSRRPRPALIRTNPTGSHHGRSPRPDRIRINRPGRIQAYSSKLRTNTSNSSIFTQTHANTGKLTQNSSIFKHEKGKETFEVHIRLSAGGASGAQPYVGAALQGCAGGVDSAHAQAQHRICR